MKTQENLLWREIFNSSAVKSVYRESVYSFIRPILFAPWGWSREYVRPYIPKQFHEKDYSDHMQSPGWQPTLCMTRCLIWWFASLEKVWSYMTLNVSTETRCQIIQHKPSQSKLKFLVKVCGCVAMAKSYNLENCYLIYSLLKSR